jgi:hypothetical protein
VVDTHRHPTVGTVLARVPDRVDTQHGMKRPKRLWHVLQDLGTCHHLSARQCWYSRERGCTQQGSAGTHAGVAALNKAVLVLTRVWPHSTRQCWYSRGWGCTQHGSVGTHAGVAALNRAVLVLTWVWLHSTGQCWYSRGCGCTQQGSAGTHAGVAALNRAVLVLTRVGLHSTGSDKIEGN